MEKLKQYKYIIIIMLAILVSVFFWFQIRPAQVRKDCIETYPKAFGVSTGGGFYTGYGIDNDKAGYEKCLREHGLNN